MTLALIYPNQDMDLSFGEGFFDLTSLQPQLVMLLKTDVNENLSSKFSSLDTFSSRYIYKFIESFGNFTILGSEISLAPPDFSTQTLKGFLNSYFPVGKITNLKEIVDLLEGSGEFLAIPLGGYINRFLEDQAVEDILAALEINETWESILNKPEFAYIIPDVFFLPEEEMDEWSFENKLFAFDEDTLNISEIQLDTYFSHTFKIINNLNAVGYFYTEDSLPEGVTLENNGILSGVTSINIEFNLIAANVFGDTISEFISMSL